MLIDRNLRSKLSVLFAVQCFIQHWCQSYAFSTTQHLDHAVGAKCLLTCNLLILMSMYNMIGLGSCIQHTCVIHAGKRFPVFSMSLIRTIIFYPLEGHIPAYLPFFCCPFYLFPPILAMFLVPEGFSICYIKYILLMKAASRDCFWWYKSWPIGQYMISRIGTLFACLWGLHRKLLSIPCQNHKSHNFKCTR